MATRWATTRTSRARAARSLPERFRPTGSPLPVGNRSGPCRRALRCDPGYSSVRPLATLRLNRIQCRCPQFQREGPHSFSWSFTWASAQGLHTLPRFAAPRSKKNRWPPPIPADTDRSRRCRRRPGWAIGGRSPRARGRALPGGDWPMGGRWAIRPRGCRPPPN